jgi:hypothetical protein
MKRESVCERIRGAATGGHKRHDNGLSYARHLAPGGTMNAFAIGWTMSTPKEAPDTVAGNGVEVMHEGDSMILRKVVDADKVRAVCRDIREHAPAPKKGESILEDLNASRLRRSSAGLA